MESFWEKTDRCVYCPYALLINCILEFYCVFVDVALLEPI